MSDAPTDLIQVIPGGQPSVGNKYGNAGQVNGPLGLQTSTPLTAFSLTFNNGTTYWFITPAGTLATGTFTTPGSIELVIPANTPNPLPTPDGRARAAVTGACSAVEKWMKPSTLWSA